MLCIGAFRAFLPSIVLCTLTLCDLAPISHNTASRYTVHLDKDIRNGSFGSSGFNSSSTTLVHGTAAGNSKSSSIPTSLSYRITPILTPSTVNSSPSTISSTSGRQDLGGSLASSRSTASLPSTSLTASREQHDAPLSPSSNPFSASPSLGSVMTVGSGGSSISIANIHNLTASHVTSTDPTVTGSSASTNSGSLVSNVFELPIISSPPSPPSKTTASGNPEATSTALILAGIMKRLPSDAATISSFPDEAFTKRVRKLLDDLTSLKSKAPGPDESDRGCKRRGLLSLLTRVVCSIGPVTNLISKISIRDISLQGLQLELDAVEEAGKELEEEEDRHDPSSNGQDQQSTSTNKAGSSASSGAPSSSTVSSSGSSSSCSSICTSGISLGPSKEYMIFPTTAASPNQIAQLSSSIVAAVGIENMDSISLKPTGACFFAIMNTTTADLLRSAPGSPVVVLDGESTEEGDVGSKLVRRDLGNTSQSGEVHVLDKRRNSPYQPSGWYLKRTDAPDELKFVSTGPGQDARLVEDYVYDSVGGAGITVFVLDSGANKDNPYLKNMPGGMEFIFPDKKGFWKKAKGGYDWMTENDSSGHGTSMISKIAGVKLGVAKNVHIVVVKVPRGTGEDGKPDPRTISFSGIVKGLALIKEEVEKNYERLWGRAVINISINSGWQTMEWVDTYRKLLDDLLKLDIVIVCSSGNNDPTHIGGATGPTINTYPPWFRQELPDLIVVGAIDLNGLVPDYNQGGPLQDLAAPGSVNPHMGIEVADHTGQTWAHVKRVHGTSTAAASVSGLVAYLLAMTSDLHVQGQVANLAKQLLLKLAYSRRAGSPPALWNGLYSTPTTPHVKRHYPQAFSANQNVPLEPRQDSEDPYFGKAPLPESSFFYDAHIPPSGAGLRSSASAAVTLPSSPLGSGTDLATYQKIPMSSQSSLAEVSSARSGSSPIVQSSSTTSFASIVHNRPGIGKESSTTASSTEAPVATSVKNEPVITTSCSATFGITTGTSTTQTNVPSPDATIVQSALNKFCTPDQEIVLKKKSESESEYQHFSDHVMFEEIDEDTHAYFDFMMEWDPSPECVNRDPPRLSAQIMPRGPDYWCMQRLSQLKQSCMLRGGTLEIDCVKWGYQAWTVHMTREHRGPGYCGRQCRRRREKRD